MEFKKTKQKKTSLSRKSLFPDEKRGNPAILCPNTPTVLLFETLYFHILCTQKKTATCAMGKIWKYSLGEYTFSVYEIYMNRRYFVK